MCPAAYKERQAAECDTKCTMQGVEYESRSINIRPEMKAMYNEACDVWYLVGTTNIHKPVCMPLPLALPDS